MDLGGVLTDTVLSVTVTEAKPDLLLLLWRPLVSANRRLWLGSGL